MHSYLTACLVFGLATSGLGLATSGLGLAAGGLGLAVGGLGMAGFQAGNDLKPGDMAPDFSLPGSDGKTYTLSEFRGKKPVVLAWFVKAFTGG